MDKVYCLEHSYEEGEIDIVTEIAVYSTKEKAEEALAKFKLHPKFRDHPDGFYLNEYKLNECEWQEGFFTYENK